MSDEKIHADETPEYLRLARLKALRESGLPEPERTADELARRGLL